MTNIDSSSNVKRDNNIWPYVSSVVQLMRHDIFLNDLRENIDGSYPVFPCMIAIGNPNNHIMGELQGCFAINGFGGISAEDTFTIAGKTYIAFPTAPNADRTEWMCIKKE
jgi:hypothetical protein